jgi:hypothetical protein
VAEALALITPTPSACCGCGKSGPTGRLWAVTGHSYGVAVFNSPGVMHRLRRHPEVIEEPQQQALAAAGVRCVDGCCDTGWGWWRCALELLRHGRRAGRGGARATSHAAGAEAVAVRGAAAAEIPRHGADSPSIRGRALPIAKRGRNISAAAVQWL